MRFAYICLWLSLLVACTQPKPQTADRQNDPVQREKPYVVMVSLDGFRYDYAQKYEAKNLLRLAREGLSAEKMWPSYPSKTFPNHYTLVTGLYPSRHGIVDNTFYDPARGETYQIRDRQKVEDGAWYGGVPLWVLAEQQGMLAASYFWVGSEADVQGTLPSYYYRYDGGTSHQKRIDQVIDWLKLPPETRPHLITCYFSVVDSRGHRDGPESESVRAAVQEVDRRIGQLDSAFQALGLPITLIVVSDHGMLAVNTEDPIILSRLVNLDGFEVAGGSGQKLLYSDDTALVRRTYQALKAKEARHPLRVYYPEELPAHLHYTGNDRIGELVVLSEPPYVFGTWGITPSTGTHGFDWQEVPEMGAIFYAKGPTLPPGRKLPPFENVHVYPLVAHLLGLTPPDDIDGDSTLISVISEQ